MHTIVTVNLAYMAHLLFIGGPDTVGFITIRTGDNIESRLCNGVYRTALTWACDNLHNWDPRNADATQFITSIIGRSIDNCFVRFSLTSQPCLAQKVPFLCVREGAGLRDYGKISDIRDTIT